MGLTTFMTRPTDTDQFTVSDGLAQCDRNPAAQRSACNGFGRTVGLVGMRKVMLYLVAQPRDHLPMTQRATILCAALCISDRNRASQHIQRPTVSDQRSIHPHSFSQPS